MHLTHLSTERGRMRAHMLIDKAPSDWLCQVSAPKRTMPQNDKLWAMLTDISIAKPLGRKMTPEQWKAVMMAACGWEVQFLEGLDGQPFPAGFRTSKMNKQQMADLITFIQATGDGWGVKWTDREKDAS